MISPTTPGGRASRSASVGARGLGLVVLMTHREGSTGGAVLAGPRSPRPICSSPPSHAGHCLIDLETTPGATEARDPPRPHHLVPGSHLGTSPDATRKV